MNKLLRKQLRLINGLKYPYVYGLKYENHCLKVGQTASLSPLQQIWRYRTFYPRFYMRAYHFHIRDPRVMETFLLKRLHGEEKHSARGELFSAEKFNHFTTLCDEHCGELAFSAEVRENGFFLHEVSTGLGGFIPNKNLRTDADFLNEDNEDNEENMSPNKPDPSDTPDPQITKSDRGLPFVYF